MHDKELSRLNRISGQIDGIKKMISEGRECVDILPQLRAVRAAVKSVEASILEHHLKSCVSASMTEGNTAKAMEKIDELKDLFKRFDGD